MEKNNFPSHLANTKLSSNPWVQILNVHNVGCLNSNLEPQHTAICALSRKLVAAPHTHKVCACCPAKRRPERPNLEQASADLMAQLSSPIIIHARGSTLSPRAFTQQQPVQEGCMCCWHHWPSLYFAWLPTYPPPTWNIVLCPSLNSEHTHNTHQAKLHFGIRVTSSPVRPL